MSDFDAESMVREILIGAERGKRIAAARPTWPELGHVLWGYHDAASKTFYPDESRNSLVAARQSLVRPDPDSPALSDLGALHGCALNGENELVLRLSHMLIGGVVNHLNGMAALVENDSPARPAIALARVVLDGSVHACYVLESGISERDRTARAANIQIEMLLAERNDLLQAPHENVETQSRALKELESTLAHLHAAAAQDGFHRVVSRKGAKQPYLEPGHATVDQLLTRFGAEDFYRTEWRHGSSVVHLKERTIIEFMIGAGETAQEVHGRTYAAMKLLPSLLMATQALNEAADYFALDDTELGHERDRLLNVWSYGAGMRDAEIARTLGLEG
jgi:hypothetical protein